MKSITLSADEHLFEGARARARSEHSTLNEEIRRWLESYTRNGAWAARAMATIRELQGKLDRRGRKFTREEMNER